LIDPQLLLKKSNGGLIKEMPSKSQTETNKSISNHIDVFLLRLKISLSNGKSQFRATAYLLSNAVKID